ncbi:hypothetical protein VTO73DRAFT_14539 [Trametes versicolor]
MYTAQRPRESYIERPKPQYAARCPIRRRARDSHPPIATSLDNTIPKRTFHSGGVANYGCTTNETSLSSSSVCVNSSSSNPKQGTVSMSHTAQRAETRNSTHLASMRSVPPPAPAAYDGLAWRALTLRRRRGTLSGKYSDHSLYVAPSNFDGVQPGRVPKYVGQVRSAKHGFFARSPSSGASCGSGRSLESPGRTRELDLRAIVELAPEVPLSNLH